MLKTMFLGSTILLGTVSAFAFAGEPGAGQASDRLTIGSPAPALSIEKWVRGDSIAGFEKGKVYVVEFWATWCRPCVAAIPHLTELSKEHASDGVTFVAVTKPDRRNTLERVETMVKEKNEQGLMTYTVAWDGEKKTEAAYMKGADQRGIPCAFIVDKESRVAFIGHPMDLDDALDAVVKGSWNIGAAKEKYEAEYDRESRRNRFFDAMDEGDTATAYAIADTLVSDFFKDDAGTLNGIAWEIVDPDAEVKDRNLDIAMKAAKRAAELEPADPGILDTLARVHFLKGEVSEAIRLQEKAVGLEKSEEGKAALQVALDEYRAAKK